MSWTSEFLYNTIHRSALLIFLAECSNPPSVHQVTLNSLLCTYRRRSVRAIFLSQLGPFILGGCRRSEARAATIYRSDRVIVLEVTMPKSQLCFGPCKWRGVDVGWVMSSPPYIGAAEEVETIASSAKARQYDCRRVYRMLPAGSVPDFEALWKGSFENSIYCPIVNPVQLLRDYAFTSLHPRSRPR